MNELDETLLLADLVSENVEDRIAVLKVLIETRARTSGSRSSG